MEAWTSSGPDAPSSSGTNHEKSISRRKKKNAPLEMSSKKPAVVPSPLAAPKSRRHRDPRFDERCGEFKSHSFEKEYQFVSGLRKKELESVRKHARRERDPEQKMKLKNLLSRLENQESSRKQKKEAAKKQMERKSLQTQRVSDGKDPFFLKKSDKSLLDMVSKFEELKQKGGLKKYLEKKRKRNVKVDAKSISS